MAHELKKHLLLAMLAATLAACGGGSSGGNSDGGGRTDEPSDGGGDSGGGDSGGGTASNLTTNSMTPLQVGVADNASQTAKTINGQLLADGNWILSTHLSNSGGNSYSSLYLSYISVDDSLATPMTFTGPQATLGLISANAGTMYNGDFPLAMAADPSDNSVWLAYIKSEPVSMGMYDTLVVNHCAATDDAGNMVVACDIHYTIGVSSYDALNGTQADMNNRNALLANGVMLAVSESGDHSAAIGWGYNISEADNDNIATNDATDFQFRACSVVSGAVSCAASSSFASGTRLNYNNLHVDDVKLAKNGSNLGYVANTHTNPYYFGPGDGDDFYESWSGMMGDGTVRFADATTSIAIRGGNLPYGTHVRSSLVVNPAGGYLLAGRYEEESFGDGTLKLKVWKDPHYCVYQATDWDTSCYAKTITLTGEAGETFVGFANEPTLLTTFSNYVSDLLGQRLETQTKMAFMSIWTSGSKVVFRPGVADLQEILFRQESGQYSASSSGNGLTISNATLLDADNYTASELNFGAAQNVADIAAAMQVKFVDQSATAIAYTLLGNNGGVIVTTQPGTASEASELFRTSGNDTSFNGSTASKAIVTTIDEEPVVFTRNTDNGSNYWYYRLLD